MDAQFQHFIRCLAHLIVALKNWQPHWVKADPERCVEVARECRDVGRRLHAGEIPATYDAITQALPIEALTAIRDQLVIENAFRFN